MIFSSEGGVEIFSKDQKCNQKILDYSSLGGEGRSIDLLDDQLVILGDSTPGEFDKFEFKSILHPRKGLLGMKVNKEVLVNFGRGFNSPRWHTSHGYGNKLLAIGGEFQTGAQFSQGMWKSSDIQDSGPGFSRSGACKVKLEKDVFLLIGGLENADKIGVETNRVLKLNISDETVEELKTIRESRAFHSCEIFEGQVLISGGVRGNDIIADEVYNLNAIESVLLPMTSSIQRHRHQLLRLEDTIYAFGGLLADGSQTDEVKFFDWTSRSWLQHANSLLSKNTSSLTVIPFPMSAVGCNAGCTCGQARTSNQGRIVGGHTAQVIRLSWRSSFPFQVVDVNRKEELRTFTGKFLSLDSCLGQRRRPECRLCLH